MAVLGDLMGMVASPVHIVGATGRSGLALARALLGRGIGVVPVVRDAAKWRRTGLPGEPRIADVRGDGLSVALGDATRIVSCAHARHTAAILAAAPETARLVLLGSTRRFTRWPDAHGDGVIAGEAALRASGRRGVMLHPTMIYGAEGEDNVRRLARLVARLPLIPLPDGGRSLVQPIYQDDVTRCILAALVIEWREPASLVIAGPHAVTYADFVRAVARANRLSAPRIVPLPAGLLIGAARLIRVLPGFPKVGGDEIRRLLENKAFSIAPMIGTLGITPISLEDGLARMAASVELGRQASVAPMGEHAPDLSRQDATER